jgi:hypothetical protein
MVALHDTMSSSTSSSPIYSPCIIEGIVCMVCNKAIRSHGDHSLVNALLIHEQNCHTQWYDAQKNNFGYLHQQTDLSRRRWTVNQFERTVDSIVSTLFTTVGSMKQEVLKYLNSQPDLYVYCRACNILIVNKKAHARQKHYKHLERHQQCQCQKECDNECKMYRMRFMGYTSKYLVKHNRSKVLPANFSLGNLEAVKDVFHPYFIEAFNKMLLNIMAAAVDDNVGDEIDKVPV